MRADGTSGTDAVQGRLEALEPALEARLVGEQDEERIVAGQRALLLVERRFVDRLGEDAGRAGRAGQDQDQAAPPDRDRAVARIRRRRSSASAGRTAAPPGREVLRARRRRGGRARATLTRPSSAMSRETVAWVTSKPGLVSASTSSPWLPIGRLATSSRIARWRWRLRSGRCCRPRHRRSCGADARLDAGAVIRVPNVGSSRARSRAAARTSRR